MTFLKAHWQMLALTALVYALWTTPVTYPLRLLVVFFHELSHGLAALGTGGSIVSLTLSPEEGGLATTRGGIRFVILSAGYLGSLFLGVALFLIALRTHLDRAAVAGLGLCLWLIAALYMRDMFPLLFCIGAGSLLLLAARVLPISVNDLVLRIVGLASMVYVPNDIISDTIARSHLRSDARILAEEFGGATILWGGLWLVISLAVIGWTLRHGLGRGSSNIRFRDPAAPGKDAP
jgi:hypothetical protein